MTHARLRQQLHEAIDRLDPVQQWALYVVTKSMLGEPVPEAAPSGEPQPTQTKAPRSRPLELSELVARERIRDTLVRYNWSGDALRLTELAAAFCPDGELELRGREPLRGRDAIVGFLGGGFSPGGHADGDDAARRAARSAADSGASRRIVRHVLTNTRFLELDADHALVASYFTVFTEIGLDHYGRYRDTFVPVGDEWLIRHRFVSTDWRDPKSVMAPPSAVDGSGN